MSMPTIDQLNAITDAYNRQDLEAIMATFAQDAIFDHGAGSEVYGKRFEGADAIRAVMAGLFATVEDVQWQPLDTRIAGNKAICEFLRTAKLKDGTIQEFQSLDILTFKDGLIVKKDTYFKHRAAG